MKSSDVFQAPRMLFRAVNHRADGKLLWDTGPRPNIVTTVGKDFLQDTLFSGVAYSAAWFFGLIDQSSFTGVSAADTMATHAGWLEFVAYSQATRQAPTWGASASGVKTTTVGAVFTANASGNIRGAFTVNNSTKGGTTQTLWNAFAFVAPQPVAATNVITITASMTCT